MSKSYDLKTKVALIFREYNLPTQPYLASWSTQLEKSDSLAIQKFIMSGKSSSSVENLGYLPRWQKLMRLIKLSARYPGVPRDWVKQSKNLSFSIRKFVYAKYCPFLCFQPEVAHFTASNEFVSFVSWLHVIGCKSIVSFRGYDISVKPWVNDSWLPTLRDIFQKADILHFVSKYLQDEAIELGAPESKCRVIYPSTNIMKHADFGELSSSGSTIKIVSTGRLTWQKGFSQAIQAIKKIVEQGIQVDYSILGDGQEKEHLVYMVRNLGLDNHVHLKGLQTQEQVYKALSEADIYFHPSESDAIPVALMEAASMGKPIVASKVGGIPEAIENGVTGLLVPPYDIDEMIKSLLALIYNPKMRLDLGLAAQKIAVKQFSVERECQEWEDLFINLVGQP